MSVIAIPIAIFGLVLSLAGFYFAKRERDEQKNQSQKSDSLPTLMVDDALATAEQRIRELEAENAGLRFVDEPLTVDRVASVLRSDDYQAIPQTRGNIPRQAEALVRGLAAPVTEKP